MIGAETLKYKVVCGEEKKRIKRTEMPQENCKIQKKKSYGQKYFCEFSTAGRQIKQIICRIKMVSIIDI